VVETVKATRLQTTLRPSRFQRLACFISHRCVAFSLTFGESRSQGDVSARSEGYE
jgi:hypothetical protein